MNDIISNHLKSIELGKIQTHENLHVIPLSTIFNGSPEYLSLDEAMSDDLIPGYQVLQPHFPVGIKDTLQVYRFPPLL